jgi:hypothetical protein
VKSHGQVAGASFGPTIITNIISALVAAFI